jgi:Uri superfamily endonuclease
LRCRLSDAHRVKGGFTRPTSPCGKGIYTLVVEIAAPLSVEVGLLGRLTFSDGLYLYTGSALGPGGLNRRVARHLRRQKALFWHIDHLLASKGVSVKLAIWGTTDENLECELNRSLKLSFRTAARGFGSSDCTESCSSHLLSCVGHSLSHVIDIVSVTYRRLGLQPVLKPM